MSYVACLCNYVFGKLFQNNFQFSRIITINRCSRWSQVPFIYSSGCSLKKTAHSQIMISVISSYFWTGRDQRSCCSSGWVVYFVISQCTSIQPDWPIQANLCTCCELDIALTEQSQWCESIACHLHFTMSPLTFTPWFRAQWEHNELRRRQKSHCLALKHGVTVVQCYFRKTSFAHYLLSHS